MMRAIKEATMISEIIAIAVSEVAAIGAVSWIATIPEVLLAIVLPKTIAIAVLKTLSEDYQETFNIVGVERKDNDAIVLKLKTSELCDRNKIQEEYYHRYDRILTISMQDPNHLILPDTNRLVKQLNEALEKLRQTPNNITYIIREFNNTGIFQTIENSQIQGDINLLQGNKNQLAIGKKARIERESTDQFIEIKNSIMNLELPQHTKQELLDSLQQYQNYLLKIEEKNF
jgi:hypothetical protein